MKQLPNILTGLRVCCIPLLVVVAYQLSGAFSAWLSAAVFAFASITDFLDGYVARKLKAESAFGACIDPIADKLMVLTALLILLDKGAAPMLAVLLILLREMLVSGLREFLGARQIRLPVTNLAKWKTTLQMLAIIALLLGSAASGIAWLDQAGLALLWVAVFITVITGLDYTQKALKAL